MIILELTFNGELHQYCLVAGPYTVGRRGCSIELPRHATISRHHASITVAPVPANELGNIDYRPLVLLADVSKHGTTVNGELLSANEAHRPLYEGDVVMFGTVAAMQIRHYPIIVWKSPSAASGIIADVSRLGGVLCEHPIDLDTVRRAEVSPYGFFCPTTEMNLEADCLSAVIQNYVFVQPSFTSSLFTALRETPGTHVSCLPDPAAFESNCDPAMDPYYMRPAKKLYQPCEWLTSASPPTALFRSRFFVLVQGWANVGLRETILLGDGGCWQCGVDDIADWKPSTIASLPLFGLVPDEFAHGMNVCVLLHPELLEEFEISLSVKSQQPTTSVAAMRKLWDAGCTFISTTSFQRAVLSLNAAEYLVAPCDGVLSKHHYQSFSGSESDTDSDATVDGLSAFRYKQPVAQPQRPISLLQTSRVEAVHFPTQQVSKPKDLYQEWMLYRQTAEAPSSQAKKKPRSIEFSANFERKVPAMKAKVLFIAEKVMLSGRLDRDDASYLNTVHQRLVNYLDWVNQEGEVTSSEPTARSLLQCIETTVASAVAMN